LERHHKKRAEFRPELATHYLANTRDAAEFLYGPQMPKNKIQILNNAIDVDKFSYNMKTREQYRRDLRLENNLVFGHVGRFAYQKNHTFLIDIFAEIYKELPNAILLLIGEGDLMNDMKEKTKRLGIEDQVLFLGKRKDVAELYQAIDMFLLPSNFGGLDLVLVEAQTSGLICLTSDAMPSESRITDNVSFLPLDADQWKKTIRKIAAEGYNRRDRSNEIAEAGFSLDEQIKVLEQIYAGEEQ
jgi:glycosyltransferase involved in cell wall biosynthesis